MRRSYSSMEMKYGCAHSSYRNCRSSFSLSLNGVAGISSRWHHVAMTSCPPVSRLQHAKRVCLYMRATRLTRDATTEPREHPLLWAVVEPLRQPCSSIWHLRAFAERTLPGFSTRVISST